MRHNYYLICSAKKTYMPLFSVIDGLEGLVDQYWVGDFLHACSNQIIEVIPEYSDKMPGPDDGWTFIDAWQDHHSSTPITILPTSAKWSDDKE